MERLRDGPVYELAAAGESRRQRTSVSWRGETCRPMAQAREPYRIRRQRIVDSSTAGAGSLGASASSWTASRRESGNTPATAESSHWRGNEATLWATDEIAITSRVDLDLGLRATMAGASRGARAIPWSALSPSILGTYRGINNGCLTFLAGYARYPARLPLNYLACGDPQQPDGVGPSMDRRQPRPQLQPGEVGVAVAAVGPCCANGRPNIIDEI